LAIGPRIHQSVKELILCQSYKNVLDIIDSRMYTTSQEDYWGKEEGNFVTHEEALKEL